MVCFYFCSSIVFKCYRFCLSTSKSFSANSEGLSEEGSIVLKSLVSIEERSKDFPSLMLLSKVIFDEYSFESCSG
jgi:hypothetical protein